MLEHSPKDYLLGFFALVVVCVPWWVGAITLLKDFWQ